ncbi:MAG: hypothetical protein AB1726_10720 [Planctomycetota bacterium]
MRSPVPLLLALAAVLPACRSAAPPGPSLTAARPAPPPPAPDLLGWDEVSPLAFEELVEEALPAGAITELDLFQIAACEQALDRQDPLSVRAAVILGRSRAPRAGEALLARLEKRALGPERASDAGDAVAAAALAAFPAAARWAERIEALAAGPRPHPDLEVRVECACTALSLGRDAVVPFLLAVLRIGTWAGQADERDFAVSDTTAWARGRAAIALSHRAGVSVDYRTDASIAARERAVARLEEALAAGGVAARAERR